MGHLSFHAGTEGKIKKNEIKKAAGHTFRQTEQRYKNHGNKDIDPSRTHLNIDLLPNGMALDEIVEMKLEKEFKGKRALRKDAVVVREVIVQASSDYFEGKNDDEKHEIMVKFVRDSAPWFVDEFGKSNVLGMSVHMDETNPHVHVAIMPMTEDGRLSQKDFFKGPADFKRMHRQYREHMVNAGWDFDIENKNEGAKGIKLDDYKKNAQEIEEQRAELTRIKRTLKDDVALRSEVKQELKKELEPVVMASFERRFEDERKAIIEKNEEWREKQNKAYQERFDKAVQKNKQKYDERVERAEKAASKRGFQKGVDAGLKKVGKVLHDKMDGNNFVRERILKVFEGGRYEPMVNSWDNARKVRIAQKERQEMLVKDVVNTHIEMDDNDLEL